MGLMGNFTMSDRSRTSPRTLPPFGALSNIGVYTFQTGLVKGTVGVRQKEFRRGFLSSTLGQPKLKLMAHLFHIMGAMMLTDWVKADGTVEI
jgi:hypothetical protein